ncbi:tripartite tricarboxylate transporter substrate binding protein [Falsiroseomonas sp.]|uniref:Bug family tripartite tricarboxylate transporter substrate binding protein n=1 Tax=Falsiroseomonas sp. TaxID=2870721 RepID=UPI00272B48CA|nr:tripartite tricarboxylate transporter substrate binding protein [Falsiroseomonas sp.]
MRHVRSGRRQLLATAATLLAPPGLARAQDGFPNRPVRMIVPVAPGGGLDVMSRVVAQRLADLWGQPVVVENRFGAGGTIGSDLIAKAAPDGYTIGAVNSSALAIAPALLPNVPYDPLVSFTPLGLAASNDCALAVRFDSAMRSVADVVAAATARPGQLTWASAGSGTSTHMAGELFRQVSGAEMIHVPYRGSPPAVIDTIAGQVDMTFNTINALMPAIRDDRLRALATTGQTRDPLLPEVPTFAEVGYPTYEAAGWLGFAGPAGMPPELVERISGSIRQVTQSEGFHQTIVNIGMRPLSSTAEEFRVYMTSEIGRWREVVRRSAARME